MTSFIVGPKITSGAPLPSSVLVETCRALEIKTRVWYGRDKTKVDVYAPESEAKAALEMSGVKQIN